MRYSGYDIIGDIHGCAKKLENLLTKLDYVDDGGVFYHPNRQAIFLGDIVDRGPRIREALHIVKNMVDAGSAQCIIGNHEYDALGYVTPAGGGNGHYVRDHIARHDRLIAETLSQFAAYPEEWRMFLDWFRSLPVFLEIEDFRVVHACWDTPLIEEAKRRQPLFFDEAFIQESADKNKFEGMLMDRLTRGTGLALPEGRFIKGLDGYHRRLFRAKFWQENPQTFGDVAFQPDPLPEDVAQMPLSNEQRQQLVCYDSQQPPLFVGHYWLQGTPAPLRSNIACLDYGAVKNGRLVAYRYDGEMQLSADKFVWVYADNSEGE